MKKYLESLLKDEKLIKKIQSKLPRLFQIAELESSRAGKIGMEVGSLRERIIVALLIYKFGEANIQTEIPITEAEIDVKVFDNPCSIKTITGIKPKGIKLVWTVDADKALEFQNTYLPSCDVILVHINWNGEGGLYFISKEIQNEILNRLGRTAYFKLPKPGTNPRGVEISDQAIDLITRNPEAIFIPIHWQKNNIKFHPFQRWIELWEQD